MPSTHGEHRYTPYMKTKKQLLNSKSYESLLAKASTVLSTIQTYTSILRHGIRNVYLSINFYIVNSSLENGEWFLL